MQRLRQLWQSGIGGKVVVGCGGLVGVLFACAICTIVAAALTPKTSTTKTSGAVAVAVAPAATVAAAAPTIQPAPTDVSPPIATPAPTGTPAPTETPAPTDTPPPPTAIPAAPTTDAAAQNQADVRAYFSKVGPIVAKLGPALGEVGRLSGEVSDKPALLLDDNWKIDLAGQMVIVQTANTAILAIQPIPGPAQEFHDLLTKATKACSDSMDTLAKGIDTLKPATIERASEQMTDCNTKTRIATAAMPQLP